MKQSPIAWNCEVFGFNEETTGRKRQKMEVNQWATKACKQWGSIESVYGERGAREGEGEGGREEKRRGEKERQEIIREMHTYPEIVENHSKEKKSQSRYNQS